MNRKRPEKEKQNFHIATLIGVDARIEGLFDFTGTLRLDGRNWKATLTGRNGTF
jgi:cytoskeletal protein CcmA (bactofilin family)